ncbi:right-handed parallel beta-helix repeat-containing protein [Pontibacter sp. CAU 1760]
MAALVLIAFTVFSLWQQTPFFASEPPQKAFEGPIIITQGGTYSGNWESRDSEVAAVEIRTSEPVIIEHSVIRGAGYLIKSWGHGADITVRHTEGYGLTPTPWKEYKKPRRFVAVDVFRNVVVEHCYLEHTAGIYLGVDYVGNQTPENTIRIRYNKVLNIDGRVFEGQDKVQFVQLNYRGEVPHAEISWNEVINEPGRSAVEDNISLYNSRGTATAPIQIHNNYIQGAFPLSVHDANYSGGGIITDSPEADSLKATAHIAIYENQLVGLGNYCLGIAGGNNINMHHNRALVAACFKDQSPYPFWTSGVWAKDYYKTGNTFANQIHHNTLGIVGKDGTWRNEIMDSTFVAADTFANTILATDVTKDLEEREYLRWKQKLKRHSITPGPKY